MYKVLPKPADWKETVSGFFAFYQPA